MEGLYKNWLNSQMLQALKGGEKKLWFKKYRKMSLLGLIAFVMMSK